MKWPFKSAEAGELPAILMWDPRDPFNVGAAVRAASCFGVGQVWVTGSRCAKQVWAAKRTGLPQNTCFFTVLRQAMATDHQPQAGVYFGTNSGSVFASADEGDTWDEVARHLPTILSVEVMDRT